MQDKFLRDYDGYKFEDWGAYCSDDFKSFARKFKNYLRRNLPKEAIIVGHRCGHYDLSGFIRNNERYVYYSYTWDRHSSIDVRNGWNCMHSVLVRHAINEKDYSGRGGHNEFCSIEELPRYVIWMFTRG